MQNGILYIARIRLHPLSVLIIRQIDFNAID